MWSILSWVVVASAVAANFSGQQVIERNLAAKGWERERGEISREQFPVAFPKVTRLEIAKSGLLRTQVSLFRGSGGPTAAIGIELLFWSRPISDEFTSDLVAADEVLTAAGIAAPAREVVIRKLTQVAASPHELLPNFSTSRLPPVGDLVIFVRERFSRGPGGQSGHVLLQFVDATAQQLAWPSAEDVEALQPASRSTLLSGNSDVPAILRPTVTNLDCKSLGKSRWRCRYRLVIDDWVGPNRPTSRHSDVFERGADDRQWRILGFE